MAQFYLFRYPVDGCVQSQAGLNTDHQEIQGIGEPFGNFSPSSGNLYSQPEIGHIETGDGKHGTNNKGYRRAHEFKSHDPNQKKAPGEQNRGKRLDPPEDSRSIFPTDTSLEEI